MQEMTKKLAVINSCEDLFGTFDAQKVLDVPM